MEIHGGIQNDKMIDFSISVNPYVPPWQTALFERCKFLADKYLYVEWLEEAFRKKFGNDTVVLAGATEAFQIIGFTLMKDANVIIPTPSYGEYERVARYGARKIFKIPPKNETDLDLESAFDLAKKMVRSQKTVLILGNPNNPTGKYLKIKENLSSLNDVIIILDEAFIDFVDYKIIEKIEDQNVIIVRSFTKSYGMPGIRVGYVKSEKFKSLFERYRSPWAIGNCGYAFMEFLLEDNGDFLRESNSKIREAKSIFDDFNFSTDSNFGCVKVDDADKAQAMLDKLGVHVRNCTSFGLKDRIRICIRKPEENEILYQALKLIQL